MEENRLKRRIFGKVDICRDASGAAEDKPGRTIRGTAIVLGEMTELYREEGFILRELIAPEAVPESLLKESDIKMTLYHNPERVLARSKRGKGTLSWERDDKRVRFEFEAPNTPDGDTALELVERGDIDGCSFWAYADYDNITTERRTEGDTVIVERTIRKFINIEDFTLTPSPAYEQTEVEADVKREKMAAIADITPGVSDEIKEAWERVEREASTAGIEI